MKKYYLKSNGLVKGYLNYNNRLGKFYISTKDETPWSKTRFTDEQVIKIAELYPEDFRSLEIIEA